MIMDKNKMSNNIQVITEEEFKFIKKKIIKFK